MDLLFDENFVNEDSVVIDFLKKNFSLTRRPKETIQAQYQLLTDFDYKEQLQSRDFTKKLYIFHGKLDRVIPYQEAEYTFNTANGSTLYTNLPSLDFGHMVSFKSAFFQLNLIILVSRILYAWHLGKCFRRMFRWIVNLINNRQLK